MTDPMRIGILETGRPPTELLGDYADYPSLFARLLHQSGAEFESWPVLDGVFPDNEHSADAWLITGSRHGVYDPLPWIAPLKAFVRQIAAAKLPLVGICFGHQIMAEALGGRAEKFDGGWALGDHNYTDETGQTRRLNAFHQDQVTKCPPGAEVIASSPFCQYAGLRYADTMLSLQPHPEFSAAFLSDLVDLRRDVLPAETAQDAAPVPDDEAATRWAVGLMLGALQANPP